MLPNLEKKRRAREARFGIVFLPQVEDEKKEAAVRASVAKTRHVESLKNIGVLEKTKAREMQSRAIAKVSATALQQQRALKAHMTSVADDLGAAREALLGKNLRFFQLPSKYLVK